MNAEPEYSETVVIENPLGFHVRPVQRFAELAKAFEGEVEVQIGEKTASGKSVMGLMGLGGTCGSDMKITTRGPDARQAVELLSYVVAENFFVEDGIGEGERPERHIDRLTRFCSIFDSDIRVEVDGQEVDGSDKEALRDLCLEPTTDVEFRARGDDAEQASTVLQKLAHYCFYVEEAMGAKSEKKG
jgi:phosphotransferase system HPr (HPr) family protein